jgi:hypothetical protein
LVYLDMEQIVLDISSAKDAALIKELLKRFKGIEVNSFSTKVSPKGVRQRIEAGLKEAEEGKVKPWKEVKTNLLKKINSK